MTGCCGWAGGNLVFAAAMQSTIAVWETLQYYGEDAQLGHMRQSLD